MAHYMYRWQFSNASAKSLVGHPEDRTATVKALIEAFGGKLHSYFFCLGEYDGVAITEFPDLTSASACSMKVASSGGFSHFETTALLTGKEAEAVMKKARETTTSYKPPN